MVSAMGLMQQRQINYTRSNESEADRLGIQTLARSHYDPTAMADFFVLMQGRSRANAANYWGEAPDWLMTHPVTITRITEAKERAEQLRRESGTSEVCVRDPDGPAQCRRESAAKPQYSSENTQNPLIPGNLAASLASTLDTAGTGQFDLARERLRVLSADSPRDSLREYERLAGIGKLDDAQRYGQAVARLLTGEATVAAGTFSELLAKRPGDMWLTLALAEAESRSGKAASADTRFEALLRQMPNNRAVVLTYARALVERDTAASGKRAQAVLRPLVGRSTGDPEFQQLFARACEIGGDPVRAGEAFAEAAYLNGRPEQALVQLNTLKKRSDLDYYARARIEARIDAITPTVLELRRQGIRDEDLRRE